MATREGVEEVFRQVVNENAPVCLNAIALHDYVRDQVKFGFNKYFDAPSPDYTLTCDYGHCNPKSHLMTVLFKMLGLEAYQHFIAIPEDIIKRCHSSPSIAKSIEIWCLA